jgi:N-acetylmuramoyl-L-alanine amidase
MSTALSTIALGVLGALAVQSCCMLKEKCPKSPVAGKIVCIDPGHGGTAATDNYRVGPTGEREERINLRVALFLRDMLEAKGAHVLLTRTEDVAVPLKDRAQLAVENNADVFISIHHNATADRSVNFPIIYYHANASENQASVELGKCVAHHLSKALFKGKTPMSLCSDHTIFPVEGTAVLRHSYGIPGVIAEASFFSNPEEEQHLKNRKYNRKEAQAYLKALEEFFSLPQLPIKEKYSSGKVPPFTVLQEADRMSEVAKRWHQDFLEGKQLMAEGIPSPRHSERSEESLSTGSVEKAYDLFTRSARSFPDSYVARECHLYRSEILARLGKQAAAAAERKRVEEFYVPAPARAGGHAKP